MEIRCFEQGLCRELCEIVSEVRVDNSTNESLSENDVGRQILHHDRGHRFVEMVYSRHQVTGVCSLFGQSQVFEIAPLERQWPCLPDQTKIRERLFDDQATTLPGYDVNGVEIPITDLACGPLGTIGTEQAVNFRDVFQELRDRQVREGEIMLGALHAWVEDRGGGRRKHAVDSMTLQVFFRGSASHYWSADLIAIACEKLFTIK